MIDFINHYCLRRRRSSATSGDDSDHNGGAELVEIIGFSDFESFVLYCIVSEHENRTNLLKTWVEGIITVSDEYAHAVDALIVIQDALEDTANEPGVDKNFTKNCITWHRLTLAKSLKCVKGFVDVVHDEEAALLQSERKEIAIDQKLYTSACRAHDKELFVVFWIWLQHQKRIKFLRGQSNTNTISFKNYAAQLRGCVRKDAKNYEQQIYNNNTNIFDEFSAWLQQRASESEVIYKGKNAYILFFIQLEQKSKDMRQRYFGMNTAGSLAQYHDYADWLIKQARLSDSHVKNL